jgi:hypothetical protein
MSPKKPTPDSDAKKKTEVSLVRSSAAEYLTFVAASGQGGVEAVYADENGWLSQKMMGLLYEVETHTINYHRKKSFDDSELEAGSVIRNFRTTAAAGKTYDTQHYNLSAIIAVGYKGNSERAVQFRKCGTDIYASFTICWLTIPWLSGKPHTAPNGYSRIGEKPISLSTATCLTIGAIWVVLTVLFEITLGRALGLTWQRIIEDYNLAEGGLMGFGLAAMFVTPWLVVKWRNNGKIKP